MLDKTPSFSPSTEKSVAGVPQADDDEGDAQISIGLRNLRLGDTTSETVPIHFDHKIPHKSDMMVAYSTVPGICSLYVVDDCCVFPGLPKSLTKYPQIYSFYTVFYELKENCLGFCKHIF